MGALASLVDTSLTHYSSAGHPPNAQARRVSGELHPLSFKCIDELEDGVVRSVIRLYASLRAWFPPQILGANIGIFLVEERPIGKRRAPPLMSFSQYWSGKAGGTLAIR